MHATEKPVDGSPTRGGADGRRGLLLPLLLLGAGLPLAAALQPGLRPRPAPGAADAAQPAWVRYVVVGLGGFRGVVSEALWLRAAWLQDHGRYFELVQLAEWITALDPRATDAWVYNAWNLAYNISAMMPRHADRLPWVAAGVSLLRDRAIPANPADARLYRELGWLYQNKIGDDTDAAHLLYKLSLAVELGACLGPDGGLPSAASAAAAELASRFHLELAQMQALEARFGRLDWRLAESHALYWAWRGLPHAHGFERSACRRMIQQCLSVMIERGRLTADPAEGRFATAPNPALIAPTLAFYEETAREAPGERRTLANFLAFLLRRQHGAGDEAAARATYDRLVELAAGRHHVPPYAELAGGSRTPTGFFEPRRTPDG